MPWGWLWTLGWLLLLAGLFVGAASLLVELARRRSTEPRRDPALEILERRYAAGEIAREEYLRVRQDLSKR